MRQTISPRFATRSRFEFFRVMSIPNRRAAARSHAEYAELGRCARLLACQRKRQAERAARVQGIEYAVVPQPRRCVEGMALPFELLADRRLQLFLLGLAHGSAGALERLALDRRE